MTHSIPLTVQPPSTLASVRRASVWIGGAAALAFSCWLTAADARAQDAPPPPDNAVIQAAKDLTKGYVPFDKRTEIGEDRYWLAYVAAVGGFLIVVGLTVFAVRLLAFLAIVVSVIGGALAICISLYNRGITTWEDLAVAVVTLGVAAGIITVSAGVYVHSGQKTSS